MNYILDQMSKLGLKETYDGYMQNNSAIAEYNLAQAESQRKLAELSDKLRPIVTEFMEFGNTLLDVGLGNKSLAEAFDELSSKASSAFPQILEQGKDMFSGLVEGMEETAPELIAFIQENIPKMIDELGNLLPEFLDAGIDIVSKILEGLAEMLPDLIAEGVELVAELLGAIVDKLPDVLDTGVEVVKSLIDGISKNLPQIVSTAVNLILKLATTILQNLPRIISAGAEIIGALIKGIISLAGNLALAIATDIIPAIWKTVTGTNWASLGKDIINGLIKGISSMTAKAIEAVTGVVDGVVNAAKKLLGIKSPSRVFKQIGAWTSEGMAIGIRDELSTVEGAARDLAETVIDAVEKNFGELEKLEKEQSAKLAEIEKNKSDKIQEIRNKASESKKGLTAANIRQIEKLEEDAAKKALETEEKYAEQIKKKREELETAKLKAVKDFISEKKQLEQLSITEEAELWQQSLDAFADNSKAKVEAQIAYRDALNKVYDEITKVNETYSAKVTKINEDLAKEEKTLTDAYTKAVDDRAKSLVNFTSLFEEFDVAIDKSGAELLANLESQVKGLQEWEKEFTKLSEKAIDDGLLEELRQMGPKALSELKALNSLSDDQLTKYSDLYAEKSKTARELAIKELAPLEKETQEELVKLRETAASELDTLNNEWAEKIKNLTTTSKNELKSMQDVGRYAIEGLMNGMGSMQGSLEAKVREIAESIEKTTREVLQIKSPSRVMRQLGEWTAEGLEIGIENGADRVLSTSEKLAKGIIQTFEDLPEIVEGFSKETFKSVQTVNDEMQRLMLFGDKYGVSIIKLLKTASQMNHFSDWDKDTIDKLLANEMQYANAKLIRMAADREKDIQRIESESAAKRLEIITTYENEVQKRTGEILKQYSLLEKVELKDVDASEFSNSLESQIASLELYNESVAKLASRGLANELLSEIVGLGPKMASEVAAFADMSEDELDRYVELWDKKNSLARATAEAELIAMRLEMEEQLKQIDEDTERQLNALNSNFEFLYKELNSVTSNEMNKLRNDLVQDGVNAIKGLEQGMLSQKDALIQTAQSIADAVSSTIQSALDIHSPSRVMKGFGVNIGQGLIVGMDEMINKVAQTSQRLSDAASNALGSLANSSAKSQAYGVSSTTSSTTVDNRKSFAPIVHIHTTESPEKAMRRELKRMAFLF